MKTGTDNNRRSASCVCDSEFQTAFTMMEIMLVVAIIGIMSVIAVPYMMNSIRGNRIRSAARTITSSGRYARSMAVLRQRDVFLHINMDSGVVRVDENSGQKPVQDKEEEDEEKELSALDAYMLAEADEDAPPPDAQEHLSNLERKIRDVRISRVEIINGDSFNDGQVTITYFRNGRCMPYMVRVEDDFGDEITLEVDALSTVRAREL